MPFLAVQLNRFNEELAKILPQTDTRRRADLRALEKGSFDEVRGLQIHMITLLQHVQLLSV